MEQWNVDLSIKLISTIATAFDAHYTIVITVDFPKNNIVYGNGNFSPSKSLSILKLFREKNEVFYLDSQPHGSPQEED